MTETASQSVLFNPFQPGFTADPYPHYRELRDTDPVQEHPFGFWFVSRYEDVSAVLRAGLSVESTRMPDGPMKDQLAQMTHRDGPRLLDSSMLDRDPPDHTRLRQLVTKAFTMRAIAALEPMIVDLVDAALDRIADAGSVDLVEELAYPLPFMVISRMLGMPPADHDRLRELSGILVQSLGMVTDPSVLTAIADAEQDLHAMTSDIIARKRAAPGDDLLTALIAAEEGGDRLTDEELIAQVLLLYVAGHETTVNLIGNGVTALLRHPGQLALLRSRPDLVGNTVEEILRYDSPVQATRRITVAPHVVAGREIPAGAYVVACLASANRDERYWGPDAHEFRIDRADAQRHVSFSTGPHHCLGAALGRLEGRVAVARLVTRFPNLTSDGEITWNGNVNVRGAEKLPIRV